MLRDQQLNIRIGDQVKVTTVIQEGDKKRPHLFDGTVIKIRGSKENRTFTVRRIGAGGIGIERTWPVKMPNLTKVEVVSSGKVNRSKLYYLRNQVGKSARLKSYQMK